MNKGLKPLAFHLNRADLNGAPSVGHYEGATIAG